MLFLVFRIAHPEQFINRSILITVDRVEDGLPCGSPISRVNGTEIKIGCAHKIIGSKSGNIAWRAETWGVIAVSSTGWAAVGPTGVGVASTAGGESVNGDARHQRVTSVASFRQTLTGRNVGRGVQFSLSHL